MKIKKALCALVALFSVIIFTSCNKPNPTDYSLAAGDFLSLREAYQICLLEKADLKSINLNRYSSGLSCTNGGGDPIDSSQDDRFTEIQHILINGWTRYLAENYNYTGTSDGVSLREFCGIYNGLAVVMMSDTWLNYNLSEAQENIGGVKFSYNDGQRLFACVVDETSLLWNNNWESINRYGEDADFVKQGYKKLSLENNISSWYVGYHGGWAYIRDGNGISRIKPDGTNKQSMGISYFTEAIIHDGWLYYVEGGFNMYTGMSVDALRRVKLDGTGDMVYENSTERKTISTGGLEGAPDPYEVTAGVFSIKGFGNWIYYLSGVSIWDVTLYRISIDGTEKQKIAENCMDFAIYDRQLFVTSYINRSQYYTKITRYDLQGKNGKVLKKNQGNSYSLLFEQDGFLYYCDYVSGASDIANKSNICRMRLDGSENQIITENISSFVAVNKNKLYFTKSALRDGSTWDRKQLLYEMDADGKNVKLLYDDIYISNIAGDAVFFKTVEYFPLSSGKGNLIRLWRLSLTDGFVVEVYNNNSTEYFAGHFIYQNELYIVVK